MKIFFFLPFLQFLLGHMDPAVHILFQQFGGFQLSPYFFFSVLDFFNLRSYFSLLVLEISVALFGLFLLFPGSSHIHPRGILMDKFFLERCLRLLKLHPQLVSALFGLFNIIQQDIDGFQSFPDFCFQLRHLPASSQQITVVFISAAADGTSGIKKLSLQRHHTEAVFIFAGNPYRIVHIINHNNPSEQGCCHIPIPLLRIHQGIRKAQHARFGQNLLHAEFLSVANACQRKKCSPSRFILLQESDHFLGCLFCFRDDILYASPKGCLYGDFIFLFYLDQIRNHSDNTGIAAFALHNTLNASPIAFITLCQV